MSPLLSVIVAVYQVAPYVAECLDSVCGQAYPHLEVIVVDDGSTDGSSEVVDEVARRDERVRVIRQDNAGLGAARNTGVEHSRGELIAFADGDDIVARGAYELMVATLVASGSDFVVGALAKQMRGAFRVPGWMAPLHRTARLGITVDEMPEMLPNVFAPNKMFRRDFWRASVGGFPTGVVYEDHLTMTRAYLAARCFDVVPEVVYRWRSRESAGPSITQRKHEVDNLRDACAVKDSVCDLVEREAAPHVAAVWRGLMFNDLAQVFRVVPHVDDEYWETLTSFVEALLGRVTPEDLSRVKAFIRLLCWLTAQRRRADVVGLVNTYGGSPADVPVRRDDQASVLDLADELPATPPWVLTLAPADAEIRARLVSVRHDEDAAVIEGVAQVVGVAAGDTRPAVSLRLVGRADGSAPVRAETIQAVPEHLPPRPTGTPEPVGFRARIPDAMLAAGTARLEVAVRLGELEICGPFTGRQEGALSAAAGWITWRPGFGLELDRASAPERRKGAPR